MALEEEEDPADDRERLVRRLVGQLSDYHQDPTRLTQLKGLVRADVALCEPLVAALFHALHRDNADVRLGALKLCVEFFARSHRFRQLLTDVFQDFLLLTTETDPLRHPLPTEPRDVAFELKETTLKTVKAWHDKYGPAYRKLQLAYSFLKDCKSLDFERLEALTRVEQQRRSEEESRRERLRQKTVAQIQKDYYNDLKADVTRCLTEMNIGLQLLMPDFLDGQTTDLADECPTTAAGGASLDGGDDAKPTEGAVDLRAHGMPDSSIGGVSASSTIQVTLNVSLGAFEVTDDNRVLIETVFDCARLLGSSYLRPVAKWIQYLGKHATTNAAAGEAALLKVRTQVTLNVSRGAFEVTDDNRVLIETVFDCARLLGSSYLRPVAKWVQYLGKHATTSAAAGEAALLKVRTQVTLNVSRGAFEVTDDNRVLIETVFDCARLLGSSYLRPVAKWVQYLGKHATTSAAAGEAALLKVRTQVTLNVSRGAFEVTDDNRVLIETVFDCARLLGSSYLRPVAKWVQYLGKHATTSAAAGETALLKDLLDTKRQCTSALEKYRRLRIPDNYKDIKEDELSDLEDVPEKEGLELGSPSADQSSALPRHILDYSKEYVAVSKSVEGAAGTSSIRNGSAGDSVMEKTVPKVVPFGLDLRYWGEDKKVVNITRNDLDCQNYWKPPEERDDNVAVSDVLLAPYTSRVIPFTGHFTPVEHTCGALLADGVTRCTRRDRHRCPLHGVIQHRDTLQDADVNEMNVAGPSTSAESNTSRTPQADASSDEEAYINDVESATGAVLRTKKKKRTKTVRANRRSQPAPTRRDRLEKKLFDQKTIKRVAAVLEDLQQKKSRELFQQNFNYALSP